MTHTFEIGDKAAIRSTWRKLPYGPVTIARKTKLYDVTDCGRKFRKLDNHAPGGDGWSTSWISPWTAEDTAKITRHGLCQFIIDEIDKKKFKGIPTGRLMKIKALLTIEPEKT